MRNAIQHHNFERGTKAIARALVQESDLTVTMDGTDFYNANDFPLVYVMRTLPAYFDIAYDRDLEGFLKAALRDALEKTATGENRINLPVLPSSVTPQFLEYLDGGLMHEAFHSFYTIRHSDLDIRHAVRILKKEMEGIPVGITLRSSMLRKVQNILEDSFIERQGLKEYEGAQFLLEKVHAGVWEREKSMRNNHAKVVAHALSYFRDRCKEYLPRPHLAEYASEATLFVDKHFQDIIEEGSTTDDPYASTYLAIRFVARWEALQHPDESDDNPNMSSANTEDEDDDDPTTGDGLPNDDPPNMEYTDEDLDAIQTPEHVMRHAIAAERDFRNNLPLMPVIKMYWKKAKASPIRQDLMQTVESNTAYIRKAMSLFLQTQDYRVRKRHLSRGRLDGRKITKVITQKSPEKIFRDTLRVVGPKAAVSIMVDESGSMQNFKDVQVTTLTFASVLKGLDIPYEVVGYTADTSVMEDAYDDSQGKTALWTNPSLVRFTRYKDYHDATTLQVVRKMAGICGGFRGLTPTWEALAYSTKSLLARKEKKRVLFLITDGIPSTCGGIADQWNRIQSRKLIEFAKEQGIKVVIVNISDRRGVLPDELHIPNFSTFSHMVSKKLMETLTEA